MTDRGNNLSTDWLRKQRERAKELDNNVVENPDITGTRDATTYEDSVTPGDGPVRVTKLNAE